MANRKWLVNLDLDQNQLITPVLEKQTIAPAGAVIGQLYWDTDDERSMEYRTAGWKFIGESNLSLGTPNGATVDIDIDLGGSSVSLVEASGSNAGILSPTQWSFTDTLITALDNTEPELDIVKFSTSNLLNGGGTSVGGPTANPQADWFLDEDNFASNSDTKVASQQSIKQYVADQISGGVTYKGAFDPTASAGDGNPDLDTITSVTGDMYTVTVAGTYNWTTGSAVLEIGDVLIAESDGVLNNVADWTIVQKNETGVVTNASGVGTAGNLVEFDTDGNTVADSGIDPVNIVLLTTLASVTDKGIVEEATQAQMDAGTDTGETGAQLFVPPSKIISYVSGATDLAKYSVLVGNNSLTVIPVTHSLGTLDVTVQVYEVSTGDEVICRVSRDSASTLELEFNTAPTTSQYKVVVIG